jgi:DNA-binding transcriptional ArsR family regulator
MGMERREIEILEAQAAQASELLKLFANKNRLRVICTLYKGGKSVSELAEMLGLTQSNVSQHLAYLHRHKLVSVRRRGIMRVYTLTDHPSLELLRTLSGICEE